MWGDVMCVIDDVLQNMFKEYEERITDCQRHNTELVEENRRLKDKSEYKKLEQAYVDLQIKYEGQLLKHNLDLEALTPFFKSLKVFQLEQREWAKEKFPNSRSNFEPLVGMMEELGELSHSHLKDFQGIRKNEDHVAGKKDALGDILIYLLDYCNLEGFDAQQILETTWKHVSERKVGATQVESMPIDSTVTPSKSTSYVDPW